MPRRKAFFFGFKPWKDEVPNWFPDLECTVLSRKAPTMLIHGWPFRLLLYKKPEVYVWGFKYWPFLKIFCGICGIPFFHVEDGFLRSVALGAHRSPPASLIVDSRTMHYDARNASDLELILETYDFASDKALMERAEKCIELLLNFRVSKYNLGRRLTLDAVLGKKERPRILVIGQVETDAAVKYGCDRPLTNNDLVRLAAAENPNAQIVYKPHPEVLHRTRAWVSDPAAVADICEVLIDDIAPAEAFEGVDRVYTISSLMGFEALLRGIAVTCYGLPFYAGWGVTDDRLRTSRRTKLRSVQEIFAAAYILRSRYFVSSQPSEMEAVLQWLHDATEAARVRALTDNEGPGLSSLSTN
ncbi:MULTISPECIES: capsular biosynthesis protein [Ensifer]|uniref:Capsular polysaccharide biosynthesis protein n=1 Tax=Ensifer adhaerens TaxID=106592 RepID=A0ABY8HLD0_ENSAD|nr:MULTISPECIES: capsular biosynthesis protein [Ensifer]ANK75795.1 capsular biosynthesis protein [Ensifer adhaerens]KDP72247.1 capsular biosynthesis protein [Ensifer adhaerens]KQZ48016.1 capsular biosynthesis protein [Ensifer sp. Root558]WFP92946.1 capsular polysaccharide biosynthesis protein [Ensifer adhaerens]